MTGPTLGQLLAPQRYGWPIQKLDAAGDDGTREHRRAQQIRAEIAHHEEAISCANGAIRMYAPEGGKTNLAALSKEDRDVLEQAYKTRRAAVAKNEVLHRQLAGLIHAGPPAEELAKRSDVAAAAEARYLAKCEMEAARRGDFGRLSHREEQRIRTNDIKTEMVLGEVLARARARG